MTNHERQLQHAHQILANTDTGPEAPYSVVRTDPRCAFGASAEGLVRCGEPITKAIVILRQDAALVLCTCDHHGLIIETAIQQRRKETLS